MAPSNFAVKWCQHRNNTVAVPGFSCPNPITRPFDTETDSDPAPDLVSPWTFSDRLRLEVVRKGSRILNLPSPSGPGKPPAEGAVTFSTTLSGWVGSMLCSLLFWGLFSGIPIQLTKAVVENGSDVSPFSPLPIHLCDLCGIPPHPNPETFSDGLRLELSARF